MIDSRQDSRKNDGSGRAPGGLLPRLTRRAAGASARRPKTVIVLWLALVVGFTAAGAVTGTQMVTPEGFGTGDSKQARQLVSASGLEDPAVENVLVRSTDRETTLAAANGLTAGLREVPAAAGVRGPAGSPANLTDDGRTALVQVTLRGKAGDAGDTVDPVLAAVDRIRAAHPDAVLQVAGPGSFDKAIEKIVGEDLRKAELISLPITLLILFLAFGALVAASVPLLLGATSVVAAIGGMGLISQFAPMDEAAMSLVILIGLAVGVDYSLFYIRREREERRAGRTPDAALNATAATVGRAIVVSGLTVIVAIGGLLLTGLNLFVSMGLATMLVVAIAILGSLTVLPAVLALLGDRVNRGRIPGMRRLGDRRAMRAYLAEREGRPFGFWARLADLVTRRPRAAALIAICLLGTLAIPAVDMRTGDPPNGGLADHQPIAAAQKAIGEAFPGAPGSADLVVTGERLGSRESREGLAALGRDALAVTGGAGRPDVSVSRDGRTGLVRVPMVEAGPARNGAIVDELRDRLPAAAAGSPPGATVLVGGYAASDADFTNKLSDSIPIVIGAVLALALILMLASFRSLPLALGVIGLNLVSIGATYGVVTAVFQNTWAEGLLGFTSFDAIVNWVPVFAFVILFALSMDYTILVLERMREEREAGRSPREAAREGVARTAGAVTSAAIVMVAIFSIFPTLPMADMKMFGVALAVGVLIDATVVRGIALPAVVTLLGERGLRPGRRAINRPAPATWHDRMPTPETVASGRRN